MRPGACVTLRGSLWLIHTPASGFTLEGVGRVQVWFSRIVLAVAYCMYEDLHNMFVLQQSSYSLYEKMPFADHIQGNQGKQGNCDCGNQLILLCWDSGPVQTETYSPHSTSHYSTDLQGAARLQHRESVCEQPRFEFY